MSTSEQRHDSPFVPFAKQEGDHKVHIVVLPQFDWSQLPRVESKYLNTFQRVKVNYQYGWGNEDDPERIRFVEPNTPALQSETDIFFEDGVALIVKERAQSISLYAESLVGIGDMDEDLQNLLEAIPGFSEENLLKIQDYINAEKNQPWVIASKA